MRQPMLDASLAKPATQIEATTTLVPGVGAREAGGEIMRTPSFVEREFWAVDEPWTHVCRPA